MFRGNLSKFFIEFKYLFSTQIDIQISEDEVKERLSKIPEYVMQQRDKHIGYIKIISTVLIGANSSAMLLLFNSNKQHGIIPFLFVLGLILSISSSLLIYGFHCDTYKSTINFGIKKIDFLEFIKYEYTLNSKVMIWQITLIILSFIMFLWGIFLYI